MINESFMNVNPEFVCYYKMDVKAEWLFKTNVKFQIFYYFLSDITYIKLSYTERNASNWHSYRIDDNKLKALLVSIIDFSRWDGKLLVSLSNQGTSSIYPSFLWYNFAWDHLHHVWIPRKETDIYAQATWIHRLLAHWVCHVWCNF